MKRSNLIKKIILVVLVAGIGLGLRAYAAVKLDIDYDEPVYLQAALEYSNFMRNGAYTWLAWNQTNYEHPVFYKILYGAALLTQPSIENFNKHPLITQTPMMTSPGVDYGMAGRWLSVTFGTITVAVTAAINPVAGLFLAVYTFSVKYTSEVYLEALPLLLSLLSILAYMEFFKTNRNEPANTRKSLFWLAASGMLLGMTAASKYLFAVVGLAILAHALLFVGKRQLPVKALFWLGGWGIFSLASFFVFNPYLWPHPIERFLDSMRYHVKYPSTEIVKVYDYPWWQPLRWLFHPFKYYDPRPVSAFPVQIDPLIFVMAVIGLPRTYKKQLIFFMWLVIGLVTLMLWGTKWPQYVMIIVVPYSIAAAEGVATIYEFIKPRFQKIIKPDPAV